MSGYASKKELKGEIISCGKDPVYFINNYCKISHPQKGLIPFKTWDYQNDLVQVFRDFSQTIILKSRQLGISTITAAYIAWLMLFHKEKNILVVATRQDTAKIILDKVKKIFKSLPPWLKKLADITIDNRTSFVLSNGSKIQASSTSENAGLGEALSLLVIDEAAHVDNLEELWRALGPTMAAGGRCIALSSPKGVGNWFHRMYTSAENGDNDFHSVKLSWDVHPERDEDWLRKEKKKFSKRKFAQEYECSFLSSGDTVIDIDDLAKIQNYIDKFGEPKYRTAFDRNFWIWKEYSRERNYILVGDVARGDGADNSVFHILDVESMEQVAEYRGKPTIDIFAQILFEAGTEYGQCMIVVENNNIGFSVLEKLTEMNYKNVYYSSKSKHEYVEQWKAEYMDNVVPGFTTSMKTRPLIVAKLEEFIRNENVKINSQRTLNELRTFIWNSIGRPEATKGANDDLVMSLAIACWVKDTVLEVKNKDLGYKRAFLNTMTVHRRSIDTRIPGQIGFKNPNLNDKMKQYLKFASILKG